MPSVGTTFFNGVLTALYPKDVVQESVQPNSISISLTHIEIQHEEEELPTVVRKRQVEYAFTEREEKAKRQVVLVEIRSTVVTQSPDGVQTAAQSQHFNLVVLDEDTAYLFEPLKAPLHTKEIVQLVKSQFPDHSLVVLKTHPQRAVKSDVYCMVYVMMLADLVLDRQGADVAALADKCFSGPGTTTQKAQVYFANLKKTIPNLPPCPVGTWVDEHKGALVGAGAGGLLGAVAFGPWGLVGGAAIGGLGGEVLYDAPKRQGK